LKLKSLSFHKVENVPDHVLQEMQEFAAKLTIHNVPLIESVSPNVALAALNWMIPVMIKHLVTNNEEELRKAAKMSCAMLLNNMEILIKQMQEEGEKNETMRT
jgi:hypothetical protein